MTFLPPLGPQVGVAERGTAAAHSERREGHPVPTPAAGGGAASAAARLGPAPAGAHAGKDAGEEAREDLTSDEPGAPLHGEAGGPLALRVTEGSSVGGAHRGQPSFAAELAKNVATASGVADKASADTAPGPQPAAQAEPAHAEALPARPRSGALRSPEPAREGNGLVDVAVALASSTLPESSWAPAAPPAVGASPGLFAAPSLVTPSARPAWTATATAETKAQNDAVEPAKAKAGATASAREMDSDRPSRPPVTSDGGVALAFQMISQADEPPSHMSKRFEVKAVTADRLAQAEVVEHPTAGTIALGGGANTPAVPVTTGRAPPTYDPSLADRSSPLPPVAYVDSSSSESLIRHGLSGQESPQSRGHVPSGAAPREPLPTQPVLPLRGAEEIAPVVNTSPSRAGLAPRPPVVMARPERSGPGPVVVEAGGSPSVRSALPVSITVGGSPDRWARGFPVAFARAGAVYARAASDASAVVSTSSPSPSSPRPEPSRSKSVAVGGPIDRANAVPELPAVARSAPPPADSPVARRGVAVRHSALTSLATPTGGRAVPTSPAAVETPTPTPTPALAASGHDIPRSPVTTAAAPVLPRLGGEPRSSVPSGEVRPPGAVSRAVPGGLPVTAVGDGPWMPEADRAETGAAGTDSGSPSDAPPVRAASERIRPAGEGSQASQPDGGHARIAAGELAVTAPPVAAPNPRANRARPPVAGGDVAAPQTSALTDAGPLAPLPAVSSRVAPRVDVALEVGATSQRSPRLPTPERAGVAPRSNEPQRGSAAPAPAVFQPAARQVSTPAAEPPVVAPQLVLGPFAAPAFLSAPHASPVAVETPTSALAAPEHDIPRSPVTTAAASILPRRDAEPRSSLPSSEPRPPGGLPVAAVGDGPWLNSNRTETGAAGTDASSPSDAPPVRPSSERIRRASEPSQASQRDGDRTQLVPADLVVTAPPVAAPKPRADLSRPSVAVGDVVAPLTSALTDAEPLAPLPAMSSRVPPRVDVALEVSATPQRSASFSMPAGAGLAPRADESQRGSAQPAPAVFQSAASPVPKADAEAPLVAPQVISGSFAPPAFASAPHAAPYAAAHAAPHAPGAGAVAEATAAHPTPLVVSSSATPPASRLSETRRVRAAHLDLAQQSSRSGTVATSPSTKVVGTPDPVDKGEFATSAARPTAVDSVVPRAVSGLVDRLAARSDAEPARDERPPTPGVRPVRAHQPGATASAFVPTTAATPPGFAPAFASAAPSARAPNVTGGASGADAGPTREVRTAQTAKSATRTSTRADLAEGGPSSGSTAALADEPRTERREPTPIAVSPPAPAQAHAVAPSGHSGPGALPAPATIPPSLLPSTTAPARPLYDMATADQSLQATALGRNAHVHLDTGAAGALSLHLSVRDGVADLEIDGPAAEALDLRPEDIRRALAGEGLSLGHFASRVNEAAEAPVSRAATTEATAPTAAPEAQRPRASEAAASSPTAAFASHQSGASSYGEGRKHWHDDGADTGGGDGRSPAPSGSSQSSSTSTSGDDGPRRRRGFHVTA